MAKKNQRRKLVGLVSEATGNRDYYIMRRVDDDRSEFMKYDPLVRKHVLYKVTKKNLGRNEVKKRK